MERTMFKKALIAAAAAAMLGSIGTSFADEVSKTTVIHPSDPGKVVTHKIVRKPGRTVHKVKVVRHTGMNTRVVHKKTVIKRDDGSKTVIVKPTEVKSNL